MKHVVTELNDIVTEYSERISRISDKDLSNKPLPNKWSKKEVLGHLIDSGQNNLRRFISGQYESTPPKIFYDQDFWVKANDYQHRPAADVIELWTLVNEQICAVLTTMPQGNYSKTADVGKQESKLLTLQFLAEDYVSHMKHHLNQIIPGSYDIVYK
ncbi:MAG TPA: DinB family protein [Cyclobacteriaceae bacterium]|nr:DinB family protein [Cyclobacteriaceae bacterium]